MFDIDEDGLAFFNAFPVGSISSLRSPRSGRRRVAKVFGSDWDSDDAWVLLGAQVAQEVESPDLSLRTFIGGNVTSPVVGPSGP
jgi:hypothetical protein